MALKRKKNNKNQPEEALNPIEGGSEFEGLEGDGVAGASDLSAMSAVQPAAEPTGPIHQARVFLGSLVAEYENDEEAPMVADGGIQPSAGMEVVEVPSAPSKAPAVPEGSAAKMSDSKAWGGFLSGRKSAAAELYEKGVEREEIEAREAARTSHNLFTDSEVAARAAAERPVMGDDEYYPTRQTPPAEAYTFEESYGGRTLDGSVEHMPHIVNPTEVVFEGGETLKDHLDSIRRDIEEARAAGVRKRAEAEAARLRAERGEEEELEEQVAEEALRGTWGDADQRDGADREGAEEDSILVDPGAAWGGGETEELIIETPVESSWASSRVWEEGGEDRSEGEGVGDEDSALWGAGPAEGESAEEAVVLEADEWGDPLVEAGGEAEEVAAEVEEASPAPFGSEWLDEISVGTVEDEALEDRAEEDSGAITEDLVEEAEVGPVTGWGEATWGATAWGGAEDDAADEAADEAADDAVDEAEDAAGDLSEAVEEDESLETVESLGEEAPVEEVMVEGEGVDLEEALGIEMGAEEDGEGEALEDLFEVEDPFLTAVAEGVGAAERLFASEAAEATADESFESVEETGEAAEDGETDEDREMANWDAEWGEPEDGEEVPGVEGPLFEEPGVEPSDELAEGSPEDGEGVELELAEEELEEAWESWSDSDQPSLEEQAEEAVEEHSEETAEDLADDLAEDLAEDLADEEAGEGEGEGEDEDEADEDGDDEDEDGAAELSIEEASDEEDSAEEQPYWEAWTSDEDDEDEAAEAEVGEDDALEEEEDDSDVAVEEDNDGEVIPDEGLLKWVWPAQKAAEEAAEQLSAEEILAAQEVPLQSWSEGEEELPDEELTEEGLPEEELTEEELVEEEPSEDEVSDWSAEEAASEQWDEGAGIDWDRASDEDEDEGSEDASEEGDAEEGEAEEGEAGEDDEIADEADADATEEAASDSEELPSEEELDIEAAIEEAEQLAGVFAEAQLEWAAAWTAFREGAIGEAELRERAGEISVEDDGVNWIIGFQTGQWYRFGQGKRENGWIADTPPSVADEKARIEAEEAERFAQLRAEMEYVEKEARRILALYAIGKISYEEAGEALEEMTVEDGELVYQYGVQSGRWYTQDGDGFVVHGRHIA